MPALITLQTLAPLAAPPRGNTGTYFGQSFPRSLMNSCKSHGCDLVLYSVLCLLLAAELPRQCHHSPAASLRTAAGRAAHRCGVAGLPEGRPSGDTATGQARRSKRTGVCALAFALPGRSPGDSGGPQCCERVEEGFGWGGKVYHP